MLLYKPDWDEARQRFLAWWAGEALDRAAIAVYAPRDATPGDTAPPPAPLECPPTPELRWTDLDYVSALNRAEHERTWYGGEAFPTWSPGYPGHAAIPTFLGCPLTLDWHTGWSAPILDGDDLDVQGLKIDKTGAWWRFAIRMLQRAARESAGKSIPSIGAFGGCGDTLAALRGTGRFLYDVIDRPGQVAAAEEYLMEMWFEVYDTFHDIVREAAGGSTCWFGLWSPGKFYAVQNDFSYTISPRMFRELFLPVIEQQTRFLDNSVYHVDGISAFAHVPALCELPRLQAIQILPGDGKPGPLHYLDTLRQVQRAGKNLHITIPCGEVESALALLSARGLFIQTWCGSESEGKALIENAKRWSKDRRM